jgi:hypothetical protein
VINSRCSKKLSASKEEVFDGEAYPAPSWTFTIKQRMTRIRRKRRGINFFFIRI